MATPPPLPRRRSTTSSLISHNDEAELLVASFPTKNYEQENAYANQEEDDKGDILHQEIIRKRNHHENAADELKRITGELRLQSIQTIYSSDITTRYLNVSDKYEILEDFYDDQDEMKMEPSNALTLAVIGQHNNIGYTASAPKKRHRRHGKNKSLLGISSNPLVSTRDDKEHDSSSSSCSSTSSFSTLIGTSVEITSSRSLESQSSSSSKYSNDSDDDNSSFYYSATSTDSGLGQEKPCRHCSRNHNRLSKTENENNAHKFNCEAKNHSVQEDIFSSEACKFNNCAETLIDLQWTLGDEYRAIFHSVSISRDSAANHEFSVTDTKSQEKWDKVNDATTSFVLPVDQQVDVAAAASTITSKGYLAPDLEEDPLKKDDESQGVDGSPDQPEMAISSRLLVHSSISDDDSHGGISIISKNHYLQDGQQEVSSRADKHLFQNSTTPRSSIKILREARKKASMIQEQLIRLQDETGTGLLMFMPAFMRPLFSLVLDRLCNHGHKIKTENTDALSPGDEIRIINYLYSAIRCHNSLQAMAHLDQNLDEAKVWVTCYDTLGSSDGNLMPVQVLPLHTACLSKSPVVLVQKILEAYPDAIRKRAGNSKYPIHLACESGADPAVISLLIDCWPESLYACDGQGNIPLTNLVRSYPFCQNKIEAMKLLLSALEKHTIL